MTANIAALMTRLAKARKAMPKPTKADLVIDPDAEPANRDWLRKEPTMGGKPSKGTPADKRLKENKPMVPAPKPVAPKPMPRPMPKPRPTPPPKKP